MYALDAVHEFVFAFLGDRQEAPGTSTSTGDFALPNAVAPAARDGLVAHLRDYADVPTAAPVVTSGPVAGRPAPA